MAGATSIAPIAIEIIDFVITLAYRAATDR